MLTAGEHLFKNWPKYTNFLLHMSSSREQPYIMILKLKKMQSNIAGFMV